MIEMMANLGKKVPNITKMDRVELSSLGFLVEKQSFAT